MLETNFALHLNNISFGRKKGEVSNSLKLQPLPSAGLDHLLDGLPQDPRLPRGGSGQQQRLLGLARLSPKITQIVMVINHLVNFVLSYHHTLNYCPSKYLACKLSLCFLPLKVVLIFGIARIKFLEHFKLLLLRSGRFQNRRYV